MNNTFTRKLIGLLLFFLLSCFIGYSQTKLSVMNLQSDNLKNPIGIQNSSPLLSWEIQSPGRNVMQQSYQIRAAFSEKELTSGKNLVWDTKTVKSEQSIYVKYNGKLPQSGQRVYWQVRIGDNNNRSSQWSQPAFFETGLLNTEDWKASWIEPDLKEDTLITNPSPMLRKEFRLEKTIRSARIYISSHGVYQLNINGKKVSEDPFAPGWTSYNKRLQYQVYDITPHLKTGNNALGVILGDGWYRGFLAWEKNRNCYGKNLALIAQIRITYTDNSEELLTTDNSWKCSTGPILASDIYHGETYDARLEKKDWDSTGYDDSGWNKVNVKDLDKTVLIGSESVPVRIEQTILPIKEIITPKGERVFDMGQNMVGWIQFKLQGKAGSKITLKFAEVLDKTGNFYTDNLRAAKVTDRYIFKGEGIETYEPHFTFHGFRYVKIEDYEGTITKNDLIGKVIFSNLAFTGTFECSDSLVNRLQHNIQWGLRGNFLDVPTDCPQRDERLGWTADAQVFAPTACFNVNAATYYSKWMKDVAADQRADGAVPHVAPDILHDYGSTGWADAATVIPWVVYRTYGDKTILENQYPSMKAWVNYIENQTKNTGFIFNTGFHFGDWLAFSTNRSDYPGATTDKDLIGTAYFAYSTKLLQKTAEVLGKKEDVNRYAQLFNDVKRAFQKEFMTSTGRLSSNTQTAYVLALEFDLIPENLIHNAAKRLADNVNSFGHITTGFLGTPDICKVLTDHGYADIAYKLLLRKNYPSWLYPVTQGATTIWERWDGQKPDGSFQDAGMNSFNHYAYGAIGNWLYSYVTGIQNSPQNTGYKNIIIKPYPDKKLSFAKAEYHSIYGIIASHWQQDANRFRLQVTVPANTTAEIHLPVENANSITESGQPLSNLKITPITDAATKRVIVKVGSGKYDFVCPL